MDNRTKETLRKIFRELEGVAYSSFDYACDPDEAIKELRQKLEEVLNKN